jgi:ketohexokinase
MANILGIGVATLDIITTTDGYPEENSEQRAISHAQRRGGNVTNTLVVLSQFGHQCSWAGTLADNVSSNEILEDLNHYHIDTTACRTIKKAETPTSYITINKENGSRTIVHVRDLAEYSFNDFKRIDLGQYDWIHFEGRNIPETLKMIQRLKKQAPSLPFSIEIEKPREGIEALYPDASLLLFSQKMANEAGCTSAISYMESVRAFTEKSVLVCTWGQDGAYALDAGEFQHFASAITPKIIVDTLGAGDTFNAAFIDAQIKGQNIDESLANACFVAGKKCEQVSFDHLDRYQQHTT